MIALIPLGAVAGLTIAVDAAGVGRDFSVLGHPIIAIAYFTLALTFLFARLPEQRETYLLRAGAALFFLGCAAHHVDMWNHILDGVALQAASIHHTAATAMQVVGAPLFLIALGPYISDFVWLLTQPNALRDLRARRAGQG
jgi:hypothetical protein